MNIHGDIHYDLAETAKESSKMRNFLGIFALESQKRTNNYAFYSKEY